MAMQQVLVANQIVLQEKMEKFLEFLKKQYNNISTHFSPPPIQNSTINAMYLHAAIYRNFLQHTAPPHKLVTPGITISVKCNTAGPFMHM